MATPSEVKAGLDNIAQRIRNAREVFNASKTRIVSARDSLINIPTEYQGVLDTISGYSGGNPFEALAIAETAKMTDEFKALRAEIDTLIASF